MKVSRQNKRNTREEAEYAAALRSVLARKPFLNTDGRYLTREQTHDRAQGRVQASSGRT
jgi:hypothetical protein